MVCPLHSADIYHHKRGDDFQLLADLLENDNVTPIANGTTLGWTARAHVKNQFGKLIDSLAFSWTDEAAGIGILSATDVQTSAWPVGVLLTDIEFITAAGDVVSTSTLRIMIVEDITI